MQNRLVELQTRIEQKFVREDEENSCLFEDVKKIQACQRHMEGHLANFQVGVAQKMTHSGEKNHSASRTYTSNFFLVKRVWGISLRVNGKSPERANKTRYKLV